MNICDPQSLLEETKALSIAKKCPMCLKTHPYIEVRILLVTLVFLLKKKKNANILNLNHLLALQMRILRTKRTQSWINIKMPKLL